MRQQILGLIFLTILVNFGECRSLVKRQIHLEPSLDPALQEVQPYVDDEDRDKRAVNHPPDPKFAVKSALLGFVFNPSRSSSSHITQRPKVTTTKRPTTTEDIANFEKNRPVSLDLPSELFGSTFTLVTRLSTTAGDYMINSALRLQRLLEVFRPAIQGLFGVKGVVIEANTNKPIFSDGSNTT